MSNKKTQKRCHVDVMKRALDLESEDLCEVPTLMLMAMPTWAGHIPLLMCKIKRLSYSAFYV